MGLEAGPPSAIEELRQTLLSIIKVGLARRPEGVHLTWLGGEFARRTSAPFEQYVNFLVMRDNLSVAPSDRKMAPFINRYCSDLLTLNEISDGTYTVTIKQDAPAVTQDPLEQEQKQEQKQERVESVKIKPGVWPAFIKAIEAGKRRFLNMDQFIFTDTIRKPRGNWKEVKPEYVAALGPSETIDSLEIQSRVRKWAQDNDLELEMLLETKIEAANEGPSVSDLVRIIRSLPASVTANWHIPAEVLRHLRNA